MIPFKFCLFFTFGILTFAQSNGPWAWRCTGDPTPKCVRERKSDSSTVQTNLEACKLTCGTYGSLMPLPKHVTLASTTSRFTPINISTGIVNCGPTVCPLINEAFEIFKELVMQYHPKRNGVPISPEDFGESIPKEQLTVDITIDEADDQLLLLTNEEYTLNVETVNGSARAIIRSPTFFGARHGLETLSQLIDYDDEFNSLQIVSNAIISDYPVYKYRGVIIDTARNFITVEQLKRIIDGLSYNKMNTLHWHITDSQAFPLFTPSVPNMSLFGAYSKREIYMPEDVTMLVQYAKVRGIRIVPEIDAPAHTGNGWQWGPEAGLGQLAVSVGKQPWNDFCAGPPCGQLNIANSNIYIVLLNIYKDILAAFGHVEMFHFGGDEIFLNSWNSSEEIVSWMKTRTSTITLESYIDEWRIFQEKVYQLLTEANKGVAIPGILWTSKLTEAHRLEKSLDKDKYIIQVWTKGNDPVIADLLTKGYRIIISNYDKLYLDCGFSSWVSKGNNWCSPYKDWQGIYENDLSLISKNAVTHNVDNQVLGGEAALWSEQVDDTTIDARIWPRASALAESLWSQPKLNYREVESRMLEHRRRLVLRGIRAERLQPEWCRQNTGECASETWIAEP